MSKLAYSKHDLANQTESATKWLLESEIRNSNEKHPETFGSINNYYNTRGRTCPYAYTEITAYSVELFLDLYSRTQDPRYLHCAKLAGDWITHMQYQGDDERALGSFPYHYIIPDGPKSTKSYTFDAGICIGALSELYRKTSDQKYLKAATAGANWLISQMQNPDGSFAPSYDLQTQKTKVNQKHYMLPSFLSTRFNWYEASGIHHSKIIIGLLKTHEVNGRAEKILNSARQLIHWTLLQQESTGRFKVNTNNEWTFTHTHCYATEGLLFAYSKLGDEKCAGAADRACSWLTAFQKSNGSIPDWIRNTTATPTIDLSAIAQAVRLWCINYKLTRNEQYRKSINKAVNYLLTMQDPSGGFHLTRIEIGPLRYKLPRLYSWSTIFAIHAFNLIDDLEKDKINTSHLW
ncbi:MAG: hypothetical protein M1503_06035 [Thaumarchaeota archaeon]|nr:hypothetical protein [Nitrososphaerota archaeon]MCL5317802.1 hypothetical protein [Nitrososphaerota archaeon]